MTVERLINGFKAFREAYYENQPNFYRDLVENGQHPKVMVIACSDSRVNPSIIAKAAPGELFIVRNIANLVPPYAPDGSYHGTSAAIEFAVRDLKVEDIVVLGHSHCGGIKALCEEDEVQTKREFVRSWMSIVEKARDDSLEGNAQLRHVEREAVKVSLDNLLTFPWLKECVDKRKLALHGWLFELEIGELIAVGDDGEWGLAQAKEENEY
jgi:carbonic anhydrase